MKTSASSEKTIVILCDGNFPSKGKARKLLEKASKKDHVLIACDGAVLSLVKNGMSADHIVGDMDTLPKKWQQKFRHIIHKEEEQDFNDLCKAFRFAMGLIDSSTSNIVILGATGKREDHSLGNISYLPLFAQTLREKFPKQKINISMATDYGVFVPVLNTTRLKGEIGDKISIFAFDNTLQIKSTGLEYKTDDVVFDLWWKATLNTFKKRDVLLKFSHPAKALLYFPF